MDSECIDTNWWKQTFTTVLCYTVHKDDSIRGFRIAFVYGIGYYSKKKGISVYTPFHHACDSQGCDEMKEVVEDFSIRYSSSSSDNSPPLNVVNALITATINENLHLDCIYFLFQREPDSSCHRENHIIYPTKTTTISAGGGGGDRRFHQYDSINEANNASHESKRRKRNRGTQTSID